MLRDSVVDVNGKVEMAFLGGESLVCGSTACGTIGGTDRRPEGGNHHEREGKQG